MIERPTNQPFKRIQCPDDFLPTGTINSKDRNTGEKICVAYTAHNFSVTNMILSLERKSDSKIESILPLRGILNLPFVGTFRVEFEPKIIDVGVVGGSVGNSERLIMEVVFVKPDAVLIQALEKYFINVSDNVNEQELKSAGFKANIKPTQCVFKRTDDRIEVMNKDKFIGDIKISFGSNMLRVHLIKMEKGFDVDEFIMEITAYFVKTAIKTNKRYIMLPSPPEISLETVDVYTSALGRGVSFKIWKNIFSLWTDYVLSEGLIAPTIKDKLRLQLYKVFSI